MFLWEWLPGKHQDYNADYIFATIQTLSKEDVLEKYDRNAFDAIVIDEAHHSSANSYKKVMEYFTPKLWLGMTATPWINGTIIWKAEISMKSLIIRLPMRFVYRMQWKRICYVHFIILGYRSEGYLRRGKTATEKMESFRYLTSDERVEHVMKQAEYFGHSGERVKGLIFCSRIDEANVLLWWFWILSEIIGITLWSRLHYMETEVTILTRSENIWLVEIISYQDLQRFILMKFLKKEYFILLIKSEE